MCKFYIGQKVVYIGDDLRFDTNPGKTVHVIQAIRKGFCSCAGVEILIDVGKTDIAYSFCRVCQKRELSTIFWKGAGRFRPLIEDFTEEEIESVNIDEILKPLYEPAF